MFGKTLPDILGVHVSFTHIFQQQLLHHQQIKQASELSQSRYSTKRHKKTIHPAHLRSHQPRGHHHLQGWNQKIHRRLPHPRVDPPPPPRVQPLSWSQRLSTAALPRVPPDPSTNIRENQTRVPAHNTQSKKRLQAIIQKAMISCAHIMQHSLTPENFARRKFPIHIINELLDGDTGEIMEMRYLMKKSEIS